MERYGIDISKWQGNIDWDKLKASGVEFVILRIGISTMSNGKMVTSRDSKFESYYAEATKRNIPVGGYWFSHARNTIEANREAEVVNNYIRGKKFAYPIYIDIENADVFALGKRVVTSIVNEFGTRMEQLGYFAGLYMSSSQILSYVDKEIQERYSIWVAHYSRVKKMPKKISHAMWQFGIAKDAKYYPSTAGLYPSFLKNGAVPGISGGCDLDVCYTDFPTIIKNAGLNGYDKPVQTIVTPSPAAPVITPINEQKPVETHIEPSASILKGDVDGDGKITADDANAVLQDYLGTLIGEPSAFTGIARDVADIDGDGDIDADDANEILIQYTSSFMSGDA